MISEIESKTFFPYVRQLSILYSFSLGVPRIVKAAKSTQSLALPWPHWKCGLGEGYCVQSHEDLLGIEDRLEPKNVQLPRTSPSGAGVRDPLYTRQDSLGPGS